MWTRWHRTAVTAVLLVVPIAAIAQTGTTTPDSGPVDGRAAARDSSPAAVHLQALVATAGTINSHTRFAHGSVLGPLQFVVDSVRLSECVLRLRTTSEPSHPPSLIVTEARLRELDPDSIRVTQYVHPEGTEAFVFDPPWWQVAVHGRGESTPVSITHEPVGRTERRSTLFLFAGRAQDADTLSSLLRDEISQCHSQP